MLIQRFENTIIKNNFPRPSETNDLSISNDRGVIFCDNTDGQKLHLLYRKLRRYNPVPNSRDPGYGYRNLPIQFVIEDPILRNSDHSYFIQTADLVTFLLYQQLQPSAYIQRKWRRNNFDELTPILKPFVSTQRRGVVLL